MKPLARGCTEGPLSLIQMRTTCLSAGMGRGAIGTPTLSTRRAASAMVEGPSAPKTGHSCATMRTARMMTTSARPTTAAGRRSRIAPDLSVSAPRLTHFTAPIPVATEVWSHRHPLCHLHRHRPLCRPHLHYRGSDRHPPRPRRRRPRLRRHRLSFPSLTVRGVKKLAMSILAKTMCSSAGTGRGATGEPRGLHAARAGVVAQGAPVTSPTCATTWTVV